jgi:hypothetical protein
MIVIPQNIPPRKEVRLSSIPSRALVRAVSHFNAFWRLRNGSLPV